MLVQGIENDELALGFIPFAYYEGNKDKLKLVPVDGGSGPVTPTPETIEKGTYRPLSRPVFIYVSKKAADRPEVRKFVEFYLKNADALVREVHYVSLGAASYAASLEKFAGQGK